MAKLIVTRARAGWFAYALRNYRILIDGKRTASIGAGRIVEIELPPGPHQITARLDFLGSRTVRIDADPEGTHYLAVSHNARYQKLFSLSTMLVSVLQFGLVFWLLSRVAQPAAFGIGSGWLLVPIIAGALPLLVQMPFLTFWRNQCLDLTDISGLDLTDQQIAELKQPQPLRVRMTIRGMMIAVAILAILLGVGIEGARSFSRSHFRVVSYAG